MLSQFEEEGLERERRKVGRRDGGEEDDTDDKDCHGEAWNKEKKMNMMI